MIKVKKEGKKNKTITKSKAKTMSRLTVIKIKRLITPKKERNALIKKYQIIR